jgi:conjugative transposon TraM protein
MAVEHPSQYKDARKQEADRFDSVAAKSAPEMIAMVPDEQTLAGGERIRLELGEDLLIGRQLIPRGIPIYGTTSLSGDRLIVFIHSINWDEHVYPVSLQVYDQDGLPGIYIPGVPGTESLKESANQDIGSLGTEAFSPTLAGQAAGAGIDAARSMLAKKIRRVRVVVPADYRLILKDGRKSTNL